MSLLFTLIFLGFFSFVSYINTNWKKPVSWLVVNVVVLVAFGFLSIVMNNLYLMVGLICAFGMVVDMLWWKKIPLKTNLMKYVSTFLTTVLFFPTMVFEEVYSSMHPTLPPTV